MGKKVNIWLDDATLEMWERLKKENRSKIIKNAIFQHAEAIERDPREALINNKLKQLAMLRSQSHKLERERAALEFEIENLQSDVEKITIPIGDFWGTLEQYASRFMLHNGHIYTSYTGKSEYKIHDMKDGKIYIANQRTGRTNSNFSRKTVDLALERIIAHGGKIPAGDFITVKMHEYTVVALHPRLIEENGYIRWLDEAMVPITEEMIPDHMGTTPPEGWVSNEYWKAVLIDGKKAVIGKGRKVVLFLLDDHPILGKRSNDNEFPWATKHWIIEHPGIFSWGHDGYVHSIVGSF